MKTTGRRKPPGPDDVFLVRKISWLDRYHLSRRSREQAQALTGRLAVWNQELRSPERILEALELTEADLLLLKDLSGRPQGWQPYEFDARDGAEARRLADLGLVRLAWWRRLVRLTGAGRILLTLTDIDPGIKKADRTKNPPTGVKTAPEYKEAAGRGPDGGG